MTTILHDAIKKVLNEMKTEQALDEYYFCNILEILAKLCKDYKVKYLYKNFANSVDNIYMFAFDFETSFRINKSLSTHYINKAKCNYCSVSAIFQRALLYKIYTRQLSEKTIQTYIADYKRFCTVKGFDKQDIRDIASCGDLNNYTICLFRKVVIIPSAYKNYKTILNLIYDYALKTGIINNNPVEKLPSYKCFDNATHKVYCETIEDNSFYGREHKKLMLRIKVYNLTELDSLFCCFYLKMGPEEFDKKVKKYNIPRNENGCYLISDLDKIKNCA